MKCPHCRVEFHDEPNHIHLGRDSDGDWVIEVRTCPNPKCKKIILKLQNGSAMFSERGNFINMAPKKDFLVYPKGSPRSPCPPEVPIKYAEDYNEACMVLTDSPKASAALSRRCLQNILRDIAKVKPGKLSDEIQQVIDRGNLPSHISESIDAIRIIGNLAAHPEKDKSTGEIISVEPGEAEWNLDVLESLFDFYFVQPEITKKKKEALNQKLKKAGKPLMR